MGMLRKRHSREEIATKLLQSDKMVEEGKLQAEIARVLGVSLMTYHRWRKARQPASSVGAAATPNAKENNDLVLGKRDLLGRISQLHSENSRLRRLVTDLLLETDKLEESLAAPPHLPQGKIPAASVRRRDGPSRRGAKRRLDSSLGKTR